jgi:hypothetical protein
MKQLLGLILWLLCAFALGEIDGTRRFAGDYARGYGAGYAAGQNAPRAEDPIAHRLLCRYAEVACVRGTK